MPFRLGLLFCLILPLQQMEALNIYLNKAAHLVEPMFTLGEVATIVNANRMYNRLNSLTIGVTPERLTLLPVRVIKERIGPYIEGQVFVIGGRIALIPLRFIPREDLWFFQQLLFFLNNYEADKSGRIEVEIISYPLSTKSPAGSSSTVFRLLRFKRFQDHLVGEAEVSYSISGIPGIEDYSGSFMIWIHHFLPVARARENLNPNQALTEQNIYFVEEDISLTNGNFLLSTDDPVLYRITSRLSEGSLIDRNQLQRNLAVKKGDTITINFLKPGLRITLSGKALGSGVIGERIEVKPQDSAKRFMGRISSSREVVIENP